MQEHEPSAQSAPEPSGSAALEVDAQGPKGGETAEALTAAATPEGPTGTGQEALTWGTTRDADGSKDGAGGTEDGAPEERGGRRLDRRSAWLLGACCVAQFMVILDISIVNVALPSIQSALNFNSAYVPWIVDAYAITFASFLMLGGRVADYFGQRRTFVTALLLFALASLIGGLAPNRDVLIAARAFQGFAGAFMAACSLAIITASFAVGPARNRAIGLWAAMNGLGGSAGVLLGGVLTYEISWRWVFLINPPIGIVTAVIAYLFVQERRNRARGTNFDVAGAVTLTLGQVILVYGIVEAGLAGWSAPTSIGPIIAGVLVLALFGYIEARLAKEPLIPFPELPRPLRVANNVVILFSAAIFPMWLLSSLYLQQVLNLSPLNTGLIFLPMTLMIMLVAGRAGKLVNRYGARAVLSAGLVMLAVGLVLMAGIGPTGSPIIYIMLPGLLATAGIAMSIVPSTIAAVQGAKEGQTGLASGLVNTSRQIGGGLGLAVLITLATQHTTNQLGAGVGERQALTDGFRLAFLICAGLAVAAALVTRALPSGGAAFAPARRLAVVTGAVVAGFIALVIAFAGSHGPPIGEYTKTGAYSYISAPALHPPKIEREGAIASGALAPGYIFTTNFFNLNHPPLVGQSGPLILDSKLQPVWFEPVPEKVAASTLSLESYRGAPALAWWQGVVTAAGATESGEWVVVNQHYQTVATLRGADGWKLTLHAFVIDGEDAWVTANKNVAHNLSAYGGAYNGALVDSAVQEYNLRTGKLVRSWDALEHVPLSESHSTVPTNGYPWDAYHVNAIDPLPGGDLLVSMRNTWAAYLVNADTGAIDWTLGGRGSSFKFGPGAAFQWQHDVTMQNSSTVSLFDDHCCQLTGGGSRVPATGASRGLVLKIDPATHTATLGAQYPGDGTFESEFMGSTQPLANGNAFVGWGSEPFFSEFDHSGKPLLQAYFPRPDLSYRSMLEPWVGLPLQPPVGAARETDGHTTVYASWNGATRLTSWRVLAGAGEHYSVVARAPKTGFETAIAAPAGERSFKVVALGADGHVLGTSVAFGPTG